jgi:hypothetical protein
LADFAIPPPALWILCAGRNDPYPCGDFQRISGEAEPTLAQPPIIQAAGLIYYNWDTALMRSFSATTLSTGHHANTHGPHAHASNSARLDPRSNCPVEQPHVLQGDTHRLRECANKRCRYRQSLPTRLPRKKPGRQHPVEHQAAFCSLMSSQLSVRASVMVGKPAPPPDNSSH